MGLLHSIFSINWNIYFKTAQELNYFGSTLLCVGQYHFSIIISPPVRVALTLTTIRKAHYSEAISLNILSKFTSQ